MLTPRSPGHYLGVCGSLVCGIMGRIGLAARLTRSGRACVILQFGLPVKEYDWPDAFWFAGRTRGARWVVGAERVESDAAVAAADEQMEAVVGETSARDVDMETYLRAKGLSGEALAVAEAAYGNDFGCALRQMGAFEIAEEARHWSYDDKYLVVGPSLGELTRRMAERLDVRLNAAVEVVDGSAAQGEGVVRLRCEDGRQFEAAHVVVTVPHRMLQEGLPRFVPPLPPQKTDALQRVGMGNAIKVFLAFREPLWPQGFFDVICPGAFCPEFWVTPHEHTPECEARAAAPHVITAFLSGVASERAAALPHDEIANKCVAQLDAMIGNGEAHPEASGGGTSASATPASDLLAGWRVVDWAKVPYVRGAYSYPSAFAAGARAALATPSHGGRVLYAGEATNASANPCMQAAIETGHRAAAEVMLRRAPTKARL